MKHTVRNYCLSLLLVLLMAVGIPITIMGATTADVTLLVTFAFIGVTDNQTSYDFGVVAASSSTNTTTSQVAITNTSTVQTDITIAVTGATWTGGTAWTHSDTATAGADTVGLRAGKNGGTVADVIVKNTSPNFIYENCPASTNFTYGLQLLAPTSATDGVQKTNTLRVTAAQG